MWRLETTSERTWQLVVACVAVSLTCPLMAVQSPRKKKLIEYGVDYPSIEYTRQHIRKMEQAPFDGVVLRWDANIGGKSTDYTHTFFRKTKFPDEAVRTAINDLKATAFGRFTDNFLNLRVIPGAPPNSPDYHGDWFDDSWWQTIRQNMTAAATIARAGGLRGILIDTQPSRSSSGISA